LYKATRWTAYPGDAKWSKNEQEKERKLEEEIEKNGAKKRIREVKESPTKAF
jgi:hypothetical protein